MQVLKQGYSTHEFPAQAWLYTPPVAAVKQLMLPTSPVFSGNFPPLPFLNYLPHSLPSSRTRPPPSLAPKQS